MKSGTMKFLVISFIVITGFSFFIPLVAATDVFQDLTPGSYNTALKPNIQNSQKIVYKPLRDGNHSKPDPYLVSELDKKLVSTTLKAQGKSLKQIQERAESLQPPPSRRGMPTKGVVKIPVFLVDFSDVPHDPSQTIIDVQLKMFGDGNINDYPYESLSNYYNRSSYNQLIITGDVYGWYRAAYSRSYYESLGQPQGNDALINEILQAYDNRVNFAQYDNDKNGKIDGLFIKWAGTDNGWLNFWWAYQWTMFSPVTVDGVNPSEYVWSWYSNTNQGYPDIYYHPQTDIHETGHLLGLPDYYDYDPDIGPKGGVGGWDMMSHNWGDHNAFSKYLLGWINPIVINTDGQVIDLPQFESTPSDNSVLIMPGVSADTYSEFFIAQYREPGIGNDPINDGTNFKKSLWIWHVDARLDGTGQNFAYDNSYTPHKLLRLMEGDGREEIETGTSYFDPFDFYFPGRFFGPITIPNSRNYQGINTNVTIYNLTQLALGLRANFGINGVPPERISLGEAVDSPKLQWITGSKKYEWNWSGQNETFFYGLSAAQSGRISNNDWTAFGTWVDGPGNLSFYWKVSSEQNYDFLEFYVDGSKQSAISGDVDWTKGQWSISNGSHLISWYYVKDGIIDHGADTGWVDKVVFIRPFGSIDVSSTPSGANIYLDDVANGTTPKILSHVPIGDHTIKLTKFNYLDNISMVSVLDEQNTTVSRTLIGVGSALVSSNPPGALVYVDGMVNGTTPVMLTNITAGSIHSLKLNKTGYLNDISTFNVTTGQTKYIFRTLIADTTGSIDVSSTPLGATIYLDGVINDMTPATLIHVPKGYHKLKLNLTDYVDDITNVTVNSGQTTTVSRTLIPCGSIDISSTPSGVNVYLDSVLNGTTPIILNKVPVGTHTLRLTMTDYYDNVSSVDVTQGDTATVSRTLVHLPIGSLDVSSTPSNATIYLNGVNNGTTPKLISRIPSGDHTLQLTYTGYLDDISTVTILTGQTTTISRTLTPLPIGSISVSSIPTGATIYLDGVNKGTTPKTLTNIAAGDHSLKLTKLNYLDHISTVNIQTGLNTSVSRILTGIGSVGLYSTPTGATVFIDGVINGTTPVTLRNMSAGPTYTLKLNKIGYLDDISTFNVTAGQTKYISRILIADTTGSIDVSSTPPSATIYLDGVINGTTPAILTKVPAGSHKLNLAKLNYLDNNTIVTVTPGQTSIVTRILIPYGSIDISSIPTGAKVYLDGISTGTTPIVLHKVPVGTHTLRLTMTDYYDNVSSVDVTQGATTTVSFTMVHLPFGSINVSSTPAGANVYLDGISTGTTPIVLHKVPVGTHTLRLTMTDYFDNSSSIDVTQGTTTSVSFTLVHLQLGTIDVSSTPSWANIYIDGVTNGTTPRILSRVPSGDHTIKLTKFNYLEDISTVNVQTGLNTTISRTLVGIGSVYVYSMPTGATVFLDDVVNGTTPVTIKNVTAGPNHTLKLIKTGYLDGITTFNVTIGQMQSVYRTLQRI